jgi:hypothetical protein
VGRTAGTRWAAAGFVLAVATSLVMLLAPLGTEVAATAAGGASTGAPASPEPQTRVTHPSLLQHEGWSVAAPLSVPVLLSGAGAVAAGRRSRPVLILAAVLLGAFIVLAALSVGVFYLPAEVAIIVAAVKDRRS